MKKRFFLKMMVISLLVVMSIGLILLGCDIDTIEQGEILVFTAPNQIGDSIINPLSRTVFVQVEEQSNLESLIPEDIIITEGYTITPGDNESQNFSEGAVTYSIEDEITGDNWNWEVTISTSSNFAKNPNLFGWTREGGFDDLEISTDETSENYGAIKFYASSTPIILDTYQFSDSFEVSASVKTTRQGDTWFYFYFYDNEEEVLSGGFRVSTSKIDFTYFIAGEHAGGWYTPLANNKIDEYVDYSLIIENNKIVAIEVNNNYQEIDFPQDIILTDVKFGFNVAPAPDAYMKNFSVRSLENN